MNEFTLTDAAIERALTPGLDVAAPGDFMEQLVKAIGPGMRQSRLRLSIAWPRRQGARDQPFVVTAVLVGPAIGVCGVEERDTGVEGRVQHGDRGGLVAGRLGREPHASQRQWPTVGHRSIPGDGTYFGVTFRPAK